MTRHERRPRPALSSRAALLAAALAAQPVAPTTAAQRVERAIFTDNDEPAWVPAPGKPLADWVDEAALSYPDPGVRELARAVLEGRATKPMLRAFYEAYQVLFPFREPPSRERRLQGWAAGEARRARAPRPESAAWTSAGPTNVGGRVSAIAPHPTDPDVAYVGAAGGGVWLMVYDPAAGRAAWTPLFDAQPSLSIGAIAVDPTDGRYLYVGTGEQNFAIDNYQGVGLVRSRDAGATWLPPVSVGGAGRFGDLRVDPRDPGRVFAATSAGLYLSTDRGDTWTQALGGGIATAVVLDPSDPAVVYAAVQGVAAGEESGIWKSTAGGAPGSFARLSGSAACTLPSPGPGARVALALAPSRPSVLYAAFEVGSGQVWKTTDAGTTWCQVATPGGFCGGQCWYDMALAVDPADPDHVLAGGIYAYRSTNGGTSWSELTPRPHVDHHALAFLPGLRAALDGNDGGVYRLDLSGGAPAIRNLEAGFVTAQYYGMGADPSDARVVYGGTQDNGTHRLTDPDPVMTAVRLSCCGDGAAVRVHPALPNRVFHTVCPLDCGSGPFHFLVSDDRGASVARAVGGIAVAEGGNWVTPIEVASADVAYTATADRVYRTANASAPAAAISWAPLGSADLTPSGGSLTTLASTPADPATVWAGSSRGHVWLTRDGGASWTETWLSRGGRVRFVGRVLASRTDPATGWIALGGQGGSFDSGGHVFETTDAGASWRDMSGDLPDVPVQALVASPSDPDLFWAGTWLGIYRTADHGATWEFQDGAPRAAVAEMVLDPASGAVFAATHGRGIWKLAAAAGPKPVPDGRYDGGPPMLAAREPGGTVRVTWGAAACSGGNVDYSLYWGDLALPGAFAYTGAACALGTTGSASFAPPPGSVYWLMAGQAADGAESGHRRSDGGAGFEPAAQGAGLCPAVSRQDASQGCP